MESNMVVGIVMGLAYLALLIGWSNTANSKSDLEKELAKIEKFYMVGAGYSTKPFAYFKYLLDAIKFAKTKPGCDIKNGKGEVIAVCNSVNHCTRDKKGEIIGLVHDTVVIPVTPKELKDYEEIKRIIAEVK